MIGKQMKQAIISIAGAIMDPQFRSRKNYVRPPFVFWGPKGSGKTYNVMEAANFLKIPDINIRLGQELAEDMSYPDIKEKKNNEKTLGKIIAEMFPRYKRDDKGNKIKRRKRSEDGNIIDAENGYQIDFTSIKNYIENWDELEAYYTSLGLTVDDAPGGIIFLDEVNRIEDKQMFQMIFQLFDSGKFKGYVTPEEMSFIAACNPNEGYIVSNWFADSAFANRVISLKTKYDYDSFMEYAIMPDSGYDELTIQYYKDNPKALFDEKENNFKVPAFSSSLRNPAFLTLYGNTVKYPDPEIRYEIIGAIIGGDNLHKFHNVEDGLSKKAPTVKQILTEYDEYEVGKNPLIEIVVGKTEAGENIVTYDISTLKDAIDEQPIQSKVREKVINAKYNGGTDLINEVTSNIIEYFHTHIEDEEFIKVVKENKLRIVRFLFDLPRGKYGTVFQQLVANKAKPETTPKVAKLLTDDISGRYLVQLIRFNQERINANDISENVI